MIEEVNYPSITIVTPVLNGARYLEDTIVSVIEQQYPQLEYIIIDGGSTDGSQQIIQRYEQHISFWVSEPDDGPVDALNRGFGQSSGEIMGWLNCSDILHPYGLYIVGEVFGRYTEVAWIVGQNSVIDEQGRIILADPIKLWKRQPFLEGEYQFIPQVPTYWRRALWERSGGFLLEELEFAFDFELWARFFRYAHPCSVSGLIGAHRFHADQLSYDNWKHYQEERKGVLDREQNHEAQVDFRVVGDCLRYTRRDGYVWSHNTDQRDSEK